MNRLFRAMLVICGAIGAATGSSLHATDLQIRLQSDIAETSIRPDLDVVNLSFEVLKDGKPVESLLHVTLDSPAPSFLLSTDFPIVEGTRLIDSRVTTRDGRLDLAYVFPIRGRYRWNVTAEPLDTEESRCSQGFEFAVRENRNEIVNFAILLAVLATLGLLAGAALAQDAMRKSALDALGEQ